MLTLNKVKLKFYNGNNLVFGLFQVKIAYCDHISEVAFVKDYSIKNGSENKTFFVQK